MGMYRFVDCFDNLTQFVHMSADRCRLYGPEFVAKYDELCASAFSALDDFDVAGASSAPSKASPAAVPVVAAATAVAAEEEKKEEEEKGEGGRGNGVRPHLWSSGAVSPDGDGGLIPCSEEFISDDGWNDAQAY